MLSNFKIKEKTGFKKPSEFRCGFCPEFRWTSFPKEQTNSTGLSPHPFYNHSFGLNEQKWRPTKTYKAWTSRVACSNMRVNGLLIILN